MEHFYQNIQGWFSFSPIYASMVKHFPDGAKFLEVGAWYGCSTAFMGVEIENSQKNIEFCVVDTWEGSEENKEGGFVQDDNLVKNGSIYDIFLKNMEPVIHIIKPYKMMSLDAAKLFPDRHFDFIFVDAAHDYDNAKNDITAWFPKVKLGGFMGGHDYTHSWLGVVKAVDEFFGNISIPVQAGHESWFIYKNKI